MVTNLGAETVRPSCECGHGCRRVTHGEGDLQCAAACRIVSAARDSWSLHHPQEYARNGPTPTSGHDPTLPSHFNSDWSFNLLIYFFGSHLNIICIQAWDQFVRDLAHGPTPQGNGEPQAFLSHQRRMDAADDDMMPPPNKVNHPPHPRPEIGLYIIGWMIMNLCLC